MIEVECAAGPELDLVGVASHPAQIKGLYQILGEFCHLFRNKLNCMRLSLYLAKRQAAPGSAERWADLEAKYRDVEQFLDQLQLICRPMPLTPITLELGRYLEERRPTWERWLKEGGRRLILVPPVPESVAIFDPNRLIQALDALMAWRAGEGRAGSLIRLTWQTREGQTQLDWEEPEGPGPSLVWSSNSLALPIAVRIMTAHGGSLELSESLGLRMCLRWPVPGGPCP